MINMTGEQKLTFLVATVTELLSRLNDTQAQGRDERDGCTPAYYTEHEIELLRENFRQL